ncbi:hypothetical protein GCM10008922_48430 [Faecalicatena contorta]|uniref:hypothetical protein n=1 Tax=Faecalicatena contorta TaxID=39482 RepID=UPI0031D79943
MLERAPRLKRGDNAGLIREGYLGIGNDDIRKQSMGATTAGTFDAADAKHYGKRTVF